MASSLEPGVSLGGDRVDLPSQGVEPGGMNLKIPWDRVGAGPLALMMLVPVKSLKQTVASC